MATRAITLEGKAMWAKVFEGNRDMEGFEGGYREFEGCYTVDIILDEENRKKLKDAGSIKQGKIDAEGVFSVKLVRKHKDRFEWASGAPVVTKPDDTVWDLTSDGVIGNGSDIVAKVSVYDTSYKPGTRLDSIHVTNPIKPDLGVVATGSSGKTGDEVAKEVMEW